MGHSQSKADILQPLPLPEATHYVLAFSGGSDSTALLHCLAHDPAIKQKLSAIHVNHSIHPDSALWAELSQTTCHRLGIECLLKTIQTDKKDENSLRQARYGAMAQHLETLPSPVVLLTAHHLNDDVETILFRLIRGTGLNGLTGMNAHGHYYGIRIFRPLINTPKTQIDQYLLAHKLNCIEDSSNRDTDYDRNYIRHKIMPQFTALRPDALQRIKDSRDNLAASLDLLNELIGDSNPLPLNRRLSIPNLATYLYHWLAVKKLNPANRSQLLSFAEACLQSNQDKLPTLKTDAYELRTWHDNIYALRPHILGLHPNQCHQFVVNSPVFYWQHEWGRLTLKTQATTDIRLQIKFNQKGQKIQQPGRKHHSKVKELLREAGVPPWQRSRLPFVYQDNRLLAVGPFVSHEWRQWLTAHEAEYDWQSTDFIL